MMNDFSDFDLDDWETAEDEVLYESKEFADSFDGMIDEADSVISDELPVLPLRGVVVYPMMWLPLPIGQERSLRLVEDNLPGNRVIALVASQNEDADEPTPDQINAIDVAQVVEGAGAAALTVHGRTAQEMFRGNADWEQISHIKPHLKKIPLIGNGDLDTPEKVVNAFRNFDIDGVMIARACLGRPWLFAQAAAALRGKPIPPDPTLDQQRECLLKHFELIVQRFGETKGSMLMRRYACCYAQGRPGARLFRTHVAKVSTAQEFHDVANEYFPQEPPPAPTGT